MTTNNNKHINYSIELKPNIDTIGSITATVQITVNAILFIMENIDTTNDSDINELKKDISILLDNNNMLLNEIKRYNRNIINNNEKNIEKKNENKILTPSTPIRKINQLSPVKPIIQLNLPEAKEDTKNIQVPLDSVVTLIEELESKNEEDNIDKLSPKFIPSPPPQRQMSKKESNLIHRGAMALATDYAKKLHIADLRMNQLNKRIDNQNRMIQSLKKELRKNNGNNIEIKGNSLLDDDYDEIDDIYNENDILPSILNTKIENTQKTKERISIISNKSNKSEKSQFSSSISSISSQQNKNKKIPKQPKQIKHKHKLRQNRIIKGNKKIN